MQLYSYCYNIVVFIQNILYSICPKWFIHNSCAAIIVIINYTGSIIPNRISVLIDKRGASMASFQVDAS